MTIKEFYSTIGADYEEIMGRLRKEDRIQKFLLKFLEDGSYELLCRSIEEGDMEEAFRAAHTIKGVCQNLSLANLYEPASRLSDHLKQHKAYDEEAALLLEQVKKEYQVVTDSICKLQ